MKLFYLALRNDSNQRRPGRHRRSRVDRRAQRVGLTVPRPTTPQT